MLALSPFTLITAIVIAIILSVKHRRKWAHRLQGCRLPPGPRGWPVIGSLLDLPNCERPWTVYRKWAQQYGKLLTYMEWLCCLPVSCFARGHYFLSCFEHPDAFDLFRGHHPRVDGEAIFYILRQAVPSYRRAVRAVELTSSKGVC